MSPVTLAAPLAASAPSTAPVAAPAPAPKRRKVVAPKSPDAILKGAAHTLSIEHADKGAKVSDRTGARLAVAASPLGAMFAAMVGHSLKTLGHHVDALSVESSDAIARVAASGSVARALTDGKATVEERAATARLIRSGARGVSPRDVWALSVAAEVAAGRKESAK